MSTKSSHRQPFQIHFNRIDFYRLRGDDFYDALFTSINQALEDGRRRDRRWKQLNRYQQGVYAWWLLWGDVENGGLVQYFYNKTDAYIPALIAFLTATDNSDLASLLTHAAGLYRRHKKKFQVLKPFGKDGLFSQMSEFEKLDRLIVRMLPQVGKRIEKWTRDNFEFFAVGETGEPIDPKFSGDIESNYTSGEVFERATVRNGLLTGSYAKYKKNGELENTCSFDKGMVSANYWPNGQVKHRKIKRGTFQINEWYFPSGGIQKRYVADKSGFCAEPIRMWHENGQLAEELSTSKGDKLGLWRKFFEDGSPRLEAKYLKGEKLVVQNAWNDSRRQIVKNGTGTWYYDGVDIKWKYSLFHQFDWTHSQELAGGIPHGKEITWFCGVLWSRGTYINGKLDGIHTTYHDNGRPCIKAAYRLGKLIQEEVFPKFDFPEPAVVLEIKADARLYTEWKEPLLDVYPIPRNFDQIQSSLKVPPFLHEVFERNQNKPLNFDEYEDLNRFTDGIGYQVLVDERGRIAEIQYSGSSVYSTVTKDTYPPIIQKLRFNPGRRNGQNVPSRVVVLIEHTFKEGAKPKSGRSRGGTR